MYLLSSIMIVINVIIALFQSSNEDEVAMVTYDKRYVLIGVVYALYSN